MDGQHAGKSKIGIQKEKGKKIADMDFFMYVEEVCYIIYALRNVLEV